MGAALAETQARPQTPVFGRADPITLGASEYALVGAILVGFWNVSGVRVTVAKGANTHQAN
jgi:hypothetical protein